MEVVHAVELQITDYEGMLAPFILNVNTQFEHVRRHVTSRSPVTPETQKEVNRLRSQCLEAADELTKGLIRLDDLRTIDAHIKAARKFQIQRAQAVLDQLDILKMQIEEMRSVLLPQ
eukprot:GILK01004847.1.p1 GENE.GILK01004847.1~~GILK01004847.1.p1  ORF type:complete len:130 (-),score=23.05 GILK01004847.1:266-616(-)